MITLFIRNRQRYSLNSKSETLPSIIIDERLAGQTFIADIKENIKRQGILRADELFQMKGQDPIRLEDGRSIAHYRLQDGEVLETCSNPFFVSAMYILQAESKLIQDVHEKNNNDFMARKLERSVIHKSTIIQVLFNSNKEFGDTQPNYLRTVDEFIEFVKNHPKKGCEMSQITVANVKKLYAEFIQQDVISADPIASLLGRYKQRMLAVTNAGELNHDPEENPKKSSKKKNVPRAPVQRKKKIQRMCEHCDERAAVHYCADCQQGMVLCQQCSDFYHMRVQHNIQDVNDAPKIPKPYSPKPYMAPFALLGGLAIGRTAACGPQPILSMTEDELRMYAQRLTDTDLSDRSPGKAFGGFDAVENLITKELIIREATREPTYSLSQKGHDLGRNLLKFHNAYVNFCTSNCIPTRPKIGELDQFSVFDGREICLLIDEQEKSRERMLKFAEEKKISAQVRKLCCGDYLWILAPPHAGGKGLYKDCNPAEELVLPIVVERKSWDDLNTSMKDARFHKQMANMVKSGLQDKFFIIEGNMNDMLTKPTEGRKDFIKNELIRIQVQDGFFVSYTSSWFKSSNWLLYLSYTIGQALHEGVYKGLKSLAHLSKTIKSNTPVVEPSFTFLQRTPVSQVWSTEEFTDLLFGLEAGENQPQHVFQRMKFKLQLAQRMDKSRFLLILQGLEEYNKGRQKILNDSLSKYLQSVSQKRLAADVVQEMLGHLLHQLVHYDVHDFWVTKMKIFLGVIVIRKESLQDAMALQVRFLSEEPIGSDGHDERVNHLATEIQEDTELAEVIRRSLHEVSAHVQQYSNGETDHCESNDVVIDPDLDEDYEFMKVLELSKQDVKQERGDPPTKKAKLSCEEDDDEELKKVLEQSRIELGLTFPSSNVVLDRNRNIDGAVKSEPVVTMSEEEQLKLALELSLKEELPFKIKEEKEEQSQSHSNVEEDDLKMALEMSLKEIKEENISAKVKEENVLKIEHHDRSYLDEITYNSNDEDSLPDLAPILRHPESNNKRTQLQKDEELARQLQATSAAIDSLDNTGQMDAACYLPNIINNFDTDKDQIIAQKLQKELNRDFSNSDKGTCNLTSTPKVSKSKQQELQTKDQLKAYRQAQKVRFSGLHSRQAKATYTPTAAESAAYTRTHDEMSQHQENSCINTSSFVQDEWEDFSHLIQDKSEPLIGIYDGDISNDGCGKSSTASFSTVASQNEIIGPNAQTKCGACGNMGHSRTFKRCPNYYTDGEIERRQKIADKRRETREAEQREKQEAVENLRQQKNALDEQFAEQERILQAQKETMLGGINALLARVEPKKKNKKKK